MQAYTHETVCSRKDSMTGLRQASVVVQRIMCMHGHRSAWKSVCLHIGGYITDCTRLSVHLSVRLSDLCLLLSRLIDVTVVSCRNRLWYAADVREMDWLDDDVVYGVACALLLLLLIRELLATAAQCVPLSTTLQWLPSTVLHVIFSVEPLCANRPGELMTIVRYT